ncbi:MAG: hypothetical protein ACQEQA_04505 [Bacillota bacterium]
MFVKGELSRARALKRRKKMIKGRNIKQKFQNFMPEVIEALKDLRPFMSDVPDSTMKKYDDLIREHEENKQVTSKEKALDSLLECYDDLLVLKEAMKHGDKKHTYNDRIKSILGFLRDFHNTLYTPYKPAYEDTASELGSQIKDVAKTFKLKAAKLKSEMKQKEDEMLYYEKENKTLANTLGGLSKQSVEYTNAAGKIKENHQTITALKSHLNTLRKNHAIMENFAQMFEQLAINEAYHNNLKEEGSIRKLIKRVHKKPDSLDLMNDTTELTEALSNMKEELNELHSIIEPAQRMAFDNEEDVDDDLVSQYQSMNES